MLCVTANPDVEVEIRVRAGAASSSLILKLGVVIIGACTAVGIERRQVGTVADGIPLYGSTEEPWADRIEIPKSAKLLPETPSFQ